MIRRFVVRRARRDDPVPRVLGQSLGSVSSSTMASHPRPRGLPGASPPRPTPIVYLDPGDNIARGCHPGRAWNWRSTRSVRPLGTSPRRRSTDAARSAPALVGRGGRALEEDLRTAGGMDGAVVKRRRARLVSPTRGSVVSCVDYLKTNHFPRSPRPSGGRSAASVPTCSSDDGFEYGIRARRSNFRSTEAARYATSWEPPDRKTIARGSSE